jgi:hypothetical protein
MIQFFEKLFNNIQIYHYFTHHIKDEHKKHHHVCKMGQEKLIKVLKEDNYFKDIYIQQQIDIFHYAVFHNNLDDIKLLLNHGFKILKCDLNLLHKACYYEKNEDIILFLLKYYDVEDEGNILL